MAPATPRLLLLLILVAAVLTVRPALAVAPVGSDPDRARTLVHVLDYVAADYPAAVSGGVVISSLEYAEMVQFAVLADSLLQALTGDGTLAAEDGLADQVRRLAQEIDGKADPAVVAGLARSLRDAVVRLSGMAVAPARWPRIDAGARLYVTYCVACHGASGFGDGPLAPTMDPVPANLAEGERIAGIAPFQVFNTVRLGVEGTGMNGFPQLSEREVWDIAFFVKSIQASDRLASRSLPRRHEAADLRGVIRLEDVASLNDGELAALLEESGVDQAASAVAVLRTAEAPAAHADALDVASDRLDRALEAYRAGRADEARTLAISAYLEGVEPVEPLLRAEDPGSVVRIEEAMLAVRAAINGGEPVGNVEAAIERSRVVIGEARDLLDGPGHSAWFTFGVALSILLREALEAFLIIITILGVIRASGQRHAARWVHAGWIGAVLVGVAGWFLVDALLRFSAAQREILEGGIALLAVVVLLSVGFWLHDKSSAARWKAFIDRRVRSELGRGSLVGLALFAFFAVFREAFESVLFLSALGLDGGEHTGTAIAGATGLTFVAVLVAGLVAVRYSARIPVRQLFRYASWVIVTLAIVLAGKGVHALQEAGRLPASLTGVSIRFELLGIYPTLETILAQVLVVGTAAVLWVISRRAALAAVRA